MCVHVVRCVHVCVFVFMFVGGRVTVHVCVVCVHVCVACVHVVRCVHVCVCLFMFVVCVCVGGMSVYVCSCLCVCVCVHVHICVCVHLCDLSFTAAMHCCLNLDVMYTY